MSHCLQKSLLICVAILCTCAAAQSPNRPPSTSRVHASDSVRFADPEIPIGLIDGKNRVFIISHTPTPKSSLVGHLNGIEVYQGLVFEVAGRRVTMKRAPDTDDSLRFTYRYRDGK